MIQALFQVVKTLLEKAEKVKEMLLSQFGNHPKKTITTQSTSPTLSKNYNKYTILAQVKNSDLKKRKKLPLGCSIVIVSGVPIAADEEYLKQLENRNDKTN